jgi:hypothetical protein
MRFDRQALCGASVGRAIHCDENGFRQALQDRVVDPAKGIRSRGKHLQQPDYTISKANRYRNHRADAQYPATLAVHMRIRLRILAAQQHSASHAFA